MKLTPDMCEPKVRGYMEQQVGQIAQGVSSKDAVIKENLDLFEGRFHHFKVFSRAKRERC